MMTTRQAKAERNPKAGLAIFYISQLPLLSSPHNQPTPCRIKTAILSPPGLPQIRRQCNSIIRTCLSQGQQGFRTCRPPAMFLCLA
jgi:hypothetical protein